MRPISYAIILVFAAILILAQDLGTDGGLLPCAICDDGELRIESLAKPDEPPGQVKKDTPPEEPPAEEPAPEEPAPEPPPDDEPPTEEPSPETPPSEEPSPDEPPSEEPVPEEPSTKPPKKSSSGDGDAPEEEVAEELEEVALENLTLSIRIEPNLVVYEPGERLRRVEVSVMRGNDSIGGANVSGFLASVEPKEISFVEVYNGTYSADINYVIPKDEMTLLPISVNVSTSLQKANGTAYLVVDAEEYFQMSVNSPKENQEVALGQEVLFQIELCKRFYTDSLEVIEAFLIDTRSEERAPMQGEGLTYSKIFVVPEDIQESAHFLIWSKARINGVERDNVQEISLARRPMLHIEFDRARQEVDSGLIALEVRYIDSEGGVVDEEVLEAEIISYPSKRTQVTSLREEDGIYVGEYLRMEGDRSAEIGVQDSFGNRGKGVLPHEFFEQQIEIPEVEIPPAESPWGYILPLAILFIAGLVGVLYYVKTREKTVSSDITQKKLVARRKELRNLIKRIKLDFYKRRISPEEANERITEYEEELKLLSTRQKKKGAKKSRK